MVPTVVTVGRPEALSRMPRETPGEAGVSNREEQRGSSGAILGAWRVLILCLLSLGWEVKVAGTSAFPCAHAGPNPALHQPCSQSGQGGGAPWAALLSPAL